MALNYQSSKPPNNFTMIENEALFGLTPNAYFLYAILKNLDSDATNSNAVLMKRTNLNKHAYIKAKTELINKGWLATKQLYGNRYAFYIGKEAIKKYKYFKQRNEKNEK